MLSRPKGSTSPIKTNTTTSKKRPLSPNAPSSIARRPGTQGGFVLSSDEDDESADDENDCHLVSSKPINQQVIVRSKVPASIQNVLPAEQTKGLFPTKQVNKARLNALLGRNGKPKQNTRKALPPGAATQSSQRSADSAASNKLIESSSISQESTVQFGHNAQASLPLTLGKSLLGAKRTAAPRPQSPQATTSAVERRTSLLQQNKSAYTPGNTALIKAIDNARDKEAVSTVRPHVEIDKEKGQRNCFPALKPVGNQASTKFQSNSGGATVQSTVSSGANLNSKAQEISKLGPTILQPHHQHKKYKPHSKHQGSEVHSRCTESTQPDSCSSKQPPQKGIPGTDNDAAGDVTTAVLKESIKCLPSTPMSPKIEQGTSKSNSRISAGSKKASGLGDAKLSPPVTRDVTPDDATDTSGKALMLSRCELSKESQPYFEYSIFRKDWPSEQDENEASTEEIILHRFTSVIEANRQAERLFQSEKQYSGCMVVEYSTKQDEHGCIVLTSSKAPFDHPAHKSHTKIYVQRDYVSRLANQTPQSFMESTFISGTGYVLRLFKLIEVSDAVNADSSNSDSDSGVVASDPIRAYYPHDRPEVYTTLEAANRAARNLQVQLSHEKDPKDAMTKAFQEQDLKKLNTKVRELESAGDSDDRRWRSKFNASGLGGDRLELVVEKVGICGPRNI